jgi:hypothetical protein
MLREIRSHVVNPANDKLKIEVTDQPGAGGANHRYEIYGFDTKTNASSVSNPGELEVTSTLILFQNGPINEVGVNGITQEALIAICIDRLESFQAGPYACHANQKALEHLQEAKMWLQQRTLDRMQRGVEGTHQK